MFLIISDAFHSEDIQDMLAEQLKQKNLTHNKEDGPLNQLKSS